MTAKHIISVIVDVSLLSLVSVSVLLLFLLAKPFERGFNCDDESLRYPFKEDTVNISVVLSLGTVFPLVTILILEYLRCRKVSEILPSVVNSPPQENYRWTAYSSVRSFLFGCASCQLFTELIKYSVGRLRPHFISVCEPDWSKIVCGAVYVYPIPCTTTHTEQLREARLSFPSGHASFSAYTMIYLVIYLQVRYRFRWHKLVLPVLQLLCIVVALWTALTRISDYKHHWSDVLCGSLLGVAIAFVVTWVVSDLWPAQPT